MAKKKSGKKSFDEEEFEEISEDSLSFEIVGSENKSKNKKNKKEVVFDDDEDDDEGNYYRKKAPVGGRIVANIIDQILLAGIAAGLTLIIDIVMQKTTGYRFTRDTMASVLVAAVIYWVLNCFATEIFKNTAGRKLLGLPDKN